MHKSSRSSKRLYVLQACFVLTSCVFIISYYPILDQFFTIKSKLYHFNCIFKIPVAFWLFLIAYGMINAKSMRQRPLKTITYSLLMGIGIELMYSFIAMNDYIRSHRIFGPEGKPYELYAAGYYIAFLVAYYTASTTVFVTFAHNKRWALFFSPLIIFGAYILFSFITKRAILDAGVASISIALCLYYQRHAKLKTSITTITRAPFWKTHQWIIFGILFLAAFAIRFIWAERLIALTGDNFLRASDDGITYEPFATLIAQARGNEIGSGVLFWGGVAYWYTLGFIYKLFGFHNFKAVVFMQSLLNATVPLCIYYIGSKISSKKIAFTAAALTVVELNLIFTTGVIGTEALFVPITIAALTLATYIICNNALHNKMLAFLLGILFGISNMTRTEILYFPVILLMIIFFYAQKEPELKKNLLSFSCFFSAGLAIILFIHAYQNYTCSGTFTFTTTQAAFTFGQGGKENELLIEMNFNPFKDFFGALLVAISHPLNVAWLLIQGIIRRFLVYCFIPNFGTFDPFTVTNPGFCLIFSYPMYIQVYAFIITATGIIAIKIQKAAGAITTMLISYVLYTILLYSLIAPKHSRHRAVLMPFFILFFVYGCSWIFKKIKGLGNPPQL